MKPSCFLPQKGVCVITQREEEKKITTSVSYNLFCLKLRFKIWMTNAVVWNLYITSHNWTTPFPLCIRNCLHHNVRAFQAKNMSGEINNSWTSSNILPTLPNLPLRLNNIMWMGNRKQFLGCDPNSRQKYMRSQKRPKKRGPHTCYNTRPRERRYILEKYHVTIPHSLWNLFVC